MHAFLEGFYAFTYAAGALVCHQRPDRSFHLAGVQLPVCSRCTGIYGGALLGLAVWLAWVAIRPAARLLDARRAITMLLVASVPTILTLATGTAGLWDPSNVGRAIAGLPLGLAAGALLGAVASKDLR